jgi:signal transduction histidine kinase
MSGAHGLATLAIADGRVQQVNESASRLCGDGCVGKALDDVFDPEGARRIRELVASGSAGTVELGIKPAGGVRHAFLLLAFPSGGLLVGAPAEVRSAAERPSGVVVSAPAGHPELTAEPSADTIFASTAIAELPRNDVSALFHTIVLQAQALTHADYVAMGIGCDPTRPFDPWVSLGMSREAASRIGRIPRPVGLLGVVAREGKLVRLTDLGADPRTRGLPKHHPPMASFLGVPIHYRGKAVGNLYLANKPRGRELSDEDERKMVALAASAGAAIESASLYVTEKRHRAWLRSVIDQMPHAVLLYDEHGKLVATNQACAAMCCEPPCVDKFGNPLSLDIRAADGTPISLDELPMVRAFEKHEATFHQEAVVRTREGHLVPVMISSVPVRSNRGDVTGVATIIEDISERKSMDRMREEWSAIIAHDLRQPVGVISLAADLLFKLHAAEWSERDRKIVDRIRSASGLLARMISDLTDASLIEVQRLSLSPECVSLDVLVNSVIESLDAVGAGFQLRVSVEGEQHAWVDPDRMRQVLGNLVSNATKYGRPGTEIRIEVLGRDDAVELIVTNHGPGIPPEQVSRIFSRFERTRHARESRAAGLGLGLYIAKGIVEAHRGRIWVESIPDRTTSFHVLLPRGRPPGEGEANPPSNDGSRRGKDS